MAYVYRHIRLDNNEPFYIGIGSDGSNKRAYSNKNRNTYWYNIVSKTSYEVEIMLDDLTWEEACEKEKEFIKLYGRKDLNEGTLVNMTDGGEGNTNLSIEAKERKRVKLSLSKSGVPNYKRRGIPMTQEQKDNLVKVNTGKKYSDEVNKKKGRSGELNSFYNKKHDGDLSRFGIQNKGKVSPNRKKVENIQTKEIYSSLREASKSTNIPESTLCGWVKRENKFRYL
jgi:hypothetical protein